MGGGIGGMAAALALSQQGFDVEVFEQSAEIGEIGAGLQLGPNGFAAMDALGVGERARGRAVFTDELVMMDAIDGSEVARIPVGEAFRRRFNNPYAVIHRADIHQSIYEEVQLAPDIARPHLRAHRAGGRRRRTACVSSTPAAASTKARRSSAAMACIRSSAQRLIGDGHRVSGHVVYRALVPHADMPADLRWNAAAIWVGPNCHLVHYPLRGGEQYNIVVTFHSRQQEEWGVREGSRDEVMSYFTEICDRPRQLLDKPTSWKRWSTADRDPVDRWGEGRATLLGDAAHPMLQYLAQGACIALEDAVTLREALRPAGVSSSARFAYTSRSASCAAPGSLFRRARWDGFTTPRVSSGWCATRSGRGAAPERFYDALEWLYGWTVDKCLD